MAAEKEAGGVQERSLHLNLPSGGTAIQVRAAQVGRVEAMASREANQS
jgi:hypothetical protein